MIYMYSYDTCELILKKKIGVLALIRYLIIFCMYTE